jgi:hypothetical protein
LILQQLDLLGASCLPLVKASKAALSYSNAWITRVNRDRSIVHFSKLLGRQKAVPDKEKERQELTDIIQNLETELEMFMGHGRLLVLKPYRHLFDPAHPPSDELNYRKVRLELRISRLSLTIVGPPPSLVLGLPRSVPFDRVCDCCSQNVEAY